MHASTGVSGVCSLPGLGANASGLGEGRTPGAHAVGAHTFQIISISRFIQTRVASLYEPRSALLTKQEPLFRGVPSWTSEFPVEKSWAHRSRTEKRSFLRRGSVSSVTHVPCFVTSHPLSARCGAPRARPTGGALHSPLVLTSGSGVEDPGLSQSNGIVRWGLWEFDGDRDSSSTVIEIGGRGELVGARCLSGA